MKSYVLGLLAVLIIFLPQAAYSASDYYVMAEDYPPYCYEQGGKPTGFLVELFRLIQDKAESEQSEIHFLPWARAYKKLQDGSGDILFPMGMTPQRHEVFKFVGPIFWNNVYFYRKKGADVHFERLDDAKKVGKIAVTRGDLYYHKLVNKGFCNLDLSSDHKFDFLKLSRGRVALVPMGEKTFPFFMAENPELNADDYEQVGPPLFTTTTYIAFSLKTPDSVVKKWQRALDILMEDGSWQVVMDKFFPPKKEKIKY